MMNWKRQSQRTFHFSRDSKTLSLVVHIMNRQNKGLLIMQEPMPVATLYTSLLIGIRLNSTDTRYSEMWERHISPILQLFGPIHK